MQFKKLLPFAAIAAVLAFGFASCSDDEENDPVIEQPADAADFESVALGTDSILDITSGNSFASNAYTFNYSYDSKYMSWSGFTVSGKKDTGFKDYTTDKNSCVGHGYDKSKNFLVYYPSFGTPSTIDMGTAKTIRGFYGAVNTYVQNSILNGDGFAKKFEKGDWLRIDCIGVKEDNTTDTLSYYLADHRGNTLTYVKDWTWFDLSKLGNIKQLYFSFDSTDKTSYDGGITYYLNTPTYVLIDNFNGTYDNHSAKATEATRQ